MRQTEILPFPFGTEQHSRKPHNLVCLLIMSYGSVPKRTCQHEVPLVKLQLMQWILILCQPISLEKHKAFWNNSLFTSLLTTIKEGSSLEDLCQAAILKYQHCHRKAVVFNFMCPEPLRTCMIAKSISLAIPFPRCSGLGWYGLNWWPIGIQVP